MCAENQDQLAAQLDVHRLAQAQENIKGEFPLVKLSRLAASLAKTEGTAKFELVFGVDLDGRAYIQGAVKANLCLECQSCTQDLYWKVDHKFLLSPVYTDEQAKLLPAFYEPIMLNQEGRVFASELLEDELILQLPLLARHEESCIPKTESSDVKNEQLKKNPFAALAALKNK